MPLAAQGDTIPCAHRYVDAKVREVFNYAQEKPDVKSGIRAVKLEDVQEISQKTLSEANMLIRYCEGRLRLDNGDIIRVHVRVESREDYKRDRAEDLQACWNDVRYGEVQVPDQSLGCKR
jgi:hypothetical protein